MVMLPLGTLQRNDGLVAAAQRRDGGAGYTKLVEIVARCWWNWLCGAGRASYVTFVELVVALL